MFESPAPQPVSFFRVLAVCGLVVSGLGAALFLFLASAVAANEDYWGEAGTRLELFIYATVLACAGAALATYGVVKRRQGHARVGALGQAAAVAAVFALVLAGGEAGDAAGYLVVLALVLVLDLYVVVVAKDYRPAPTTRASR